MNEDQKYLFDLTGYLIVENALTAEEVAQCNAAIDHHIEGLRGTRYLFGRGLSGTRWHGTPDGHGGHARLGETLV